MSLEHCISGVWESRARVSEVRYLRTMAAMYEGAAKGRIDKIAKRKFRAARLLRHYAQAVDGGLWWGQGHD